MVRYDFVEQQVAGGGVVPDDKLVRGCRRDEAVEVERVVRGLRYCEWRCRRQCGARRMIIWRVPVSKRGKVGVRGYEDARYLCGGGDEPIGCSRR